MGVKVRKYRGAWWLFIHHQGQRASKKIGTQQAAKEAAARLEAELTLGRFNLAQTPTKIPTLRVYAETWLATYTQLEIKKSTAKEYASVLRRHILPALGDHPLNQLTRDVIRGFLSRKAEQGLSRSTIRNILAPLRKMLSAAVPD